MLRSRLPQIAIELEVIVQNELEKGAEIVVDDARLRVPVNTGKLRDAIHTDRQPDGVYVLGGDDDAWYGHLVEHGTAHTAPRPFLVPALEENRSEVTTRVKSGLRKLR